MALWREPQGIGEILDPMELLKTIDELRQVVHQRDEEIARLKEEIQRLQQEHEAAKTGK